MLIAVCGSSGFIGKELCVHLINLGHEIVPVRKKDFQLPIHDFKEILRETDIFINLAGAPVGKRWTNTYKKQLYHSRIDPVDKVLTAMRLLKDRPRIFISASAIGIYNCTDIHTEESPDFGDNFLSELVINWEKEVLKARELVNVRVIIFRLSVVLGRNGGAFPKMALPFRFGIGGRIGNGRQHFSFVHIEDVIRAIDFVIEHPETEGIYNLAAPETVTNRIFTKTLAGIMHRPGFFVVPSFLLKLRYGKASSILLQGQHVIPKRLTEAGFGFKYQNIETTLHSLVDK
ncbi:MAG: TIGR01777 family oxidoreductase [Bacteroidia bacterium]|nr:TIGR01777 family oxidoreductase [Bacteroidia bacterium]